MSVVALLQGFGTGAGLIIAIGSQNAFVLSNALRNHHVTAIALVCMLIDATLISAGVWGLGALIKAYPVLLTLATWGGATFLLAYGWLAFKRAFNPNGLQTNQWQSMSLQGAIWTTLALSLLNPHVYLDAVILLGSIGGQLPDSQPIWFAIGACLASVLWFSLLAWGGRLLAPWFTSPRSWRILDIAVGLTMWGVALSLIIGSSI
ncbi:MAG: amino acid transporter [Proteobacteria bacterium]|nr:MAG: amino acid transporter [Pseudomonadota bacterium]